MSVRERSWAPLLGALGLVVAGLIVVVGLNLGSSSSACSSSVTARSPLLSQARLVDQPDQRLATLARAVGRMGPPFGGVFAGVGYDYGQWLHLYGAADGLLAFTKNNAPVTMLDSTLRPRWALKPATKRIAWDASDDRFVLLDLARGSSTRVGSYSLTSGKELWCQEIAADQRDGQPVGTTFLGNGDLLVLLPKDGDLQVSRLRAADGRIRWSANVAGLPRGDYLGPLDQDTFLVGGVEEYRLAQPQSGPKSQVEVAAYSTSRGELRWQRPAEPGTQTHVAGVVDGHVLLVTASSSGSTLTALDTRGAPVWTIKPREGATESTVRGSVVLMRSKTGLDGYDVATGRPLWHRAIPTDRTYIPYGFTLSQMPSLDDNHLLMPTTSALRVLDVRTGTDQAFPLPVDGINTTYWPYQLAVTPDLIGVVTNIGGVVAARE